jgi:hypothetical protein
MKGLAPCTDCETPRRPDITLCINTLGFSFHPHSDAANAFLVRKFAQVEGDATWADCERIVAQARLIGFVVVEKR